MSGEVKGSRAVYTSLKVAGIDIDTAIDNAVRTTAFKVLDNAVRSIQTESFGEAYKRGKKTHIASKEGDAPNTDTGRLVGSIQVQHNRGDKVAFVGTNLDYGYYLEVDKNRPWLQPALDIEQPKLSERITEEVKKALKRRFKE